MRIGVKYCGGCNPAYDRKQEVERLARTLGEGCLEPVRDGAEYDRILLVCGCERACIRNYGADREGTGSQAPVYHVAKSREDFRDFVHNTYP